MISDPYVRSTLLAPALPGQRVATRPITARLPGVACIVHKQVQMAGEPIALQPR